MRKSGLLKSLGAICSLALLANVAGCKFENVESRLKDYCGTYKESIEPYEGYDKYSLMLKKKYPEKLKGIDYRDISIFLKDEINNSKMLMKGESIILPKYDCGGSEGKGGPERM